MDVGEVLVHILVVLVAAKVAAEVSERVGVPAVVGEILAGILIGPSLLDVVGQDEVLRVLGELGVILLLLEVGLEMDLGELGAVGRASVSVATVGVAVPFALGFGTGHALGMDGNEALFVGAALTATSVGITARVFGDLRALASVEARTVLGAAVADDVMGLVILTVVTRIVTEGSVSLLSVLWIVFVAVAFLVVTTAVGVRLAPPLFTMVSRYSRSAGTLVAITLAFTLAVAELAEQAKLAPIVGAFVAGIALGRAGPADRIRREIAPVSHLLVPVFFLQIGIDADISLFADPRVLGMAGVLLLVAIVGKLAAAVGMLGSPGDRLLVGIGMVPRGEVGLIFATIGLQQGVFGDDVYAALLLVVLITTVATPPALRMRLLKVRAARLPGSPGSSVVPAEGWFRDDDNVVELVSEPAPDLTLEVALEAALRCAEHRPGASMLDWLSSLPPGPLRWTRPARQRFFELLERGGPRSWRLLAISGVLERALPDLGAAVARRQAEGDLDPLAALRLPRLARLQHDPRVRELQHPERVLLAALVLEATEGDDGPAGGGGPQARPTPRSRRRRRAVGGRTGGRRRAPLRGVPPARRARSRSRCCNWPPTSAPASRPARSTCSRRWPTTSMTRTAAGWRCWRDWCRRRWPIPNWWAGRHPTRWSSAGPKPLASSARKPAATPSSGWPWPPRAYVLATAASDLARQVALCDPVPRPPEVRVGVTVSPDRPDVWWVEIVARDRPGLLARQTGCAGRARASMSLAPSRPSGAMDAHWPPSSCVADQEPVAAGLDRFAEARPQRPLSSVPTSGVTLSFDDDGSPWHTICTVRARDQRGLLHAVTTAFAAAGVNVHAARIRTAGDTVVDVFELTDGKGQKLSGVTEERVRMLLAAGVAERRRHFRSHAGPRDSVEMRPLGSTA